MSTTAPQIYLGSKGWGPSWSGNQPGAPAVYSGFNEWSAPAQPQAVVPQTPAAPVPAMQTPSRPATRPQTPANGPVPSLPPAGQPPANQPPANQPPTNQPPATPPTPQPTQPPGAREVYGRLTPGITPINAFNPAPNNMNQPQYVAPPAAPPVATIQPVGQMPPIQNPQQPWTPPPPDAAGAAKLATNTGWTADGSYVHNAPAGTQLMSLNQYQASPGFGQAPAAPQSAAPVPSLAPSGERMVNGFPEHMLVKGYNPTAEEIGRYGTTRQWVAAQQSLGNYTPPSGPANDVGLTGYGRDMNGNVIAAGAQSGYKVGDGPNATNTMVGSGQLNTQLQATLNNSMIDAPAAEDLNRLNTQLQTAYRAGIITEQEALAMQQQALSATSARFGVASSVTGSGQAHIAPPATGNAGLAMPSITPPSLPGAGLAGDMANVPGFGPIPNAAPGQPFNPQPIPNAVPGSNWESQIVPLSTDAWGMPVGPGGRSVDQIRASGDYVSYEERAWFLEQIGQSSALGNQQAAPVQQGTTPQGAPMPITPVAATGAGTGYGGTVYTQSDIQTIADASYRAGFRGEALVMAVATAMAESGGVGFGAHNQNGEDSRGPWQINVVPAANPAYANLDLSDPYVAAQAAYSISSNGTSFQPWTVWHQSNGVPAARYVEPARQVVAQMGLQ